MPTSKVKALSCKEFTKIKKDPKFIEMGFAPASKYHSLLQKFQEDSSKYDKVLMMECYKYKEIGCKELTGELCMTFDYLRNIAQSEVSYNHGGTRS